MLIDNNEDAAASTDSVELMNAPAEPVVSPSAQLPYSPVPVPEHVRHLLFGTPSAVQTTIRLFHHLGYADPNDWSRPIPTGRPHEVMVTLAKRVGTSLGVVRK